MKCNKCNDELTKDKMFKYSSYAGYSKMCKLCRNKSNLEYSRKKRARVKANPLW